MKMELMPSVTLLVAFLGLHITYLMWKPVAGEGWLIRNLRRGEYTALGSLIIALSIQGKWGWQAAWIFSSIVGLGVFAFAMVSCNTWKKMSPNTFPREER